MKMRRIISALLLAVAAAQPLAASAADLGLKEQAPDRYIVTPGDTLWSIAARFLKDPWRWPELWRLNQDELRNPQHLKPGDIIVLNRQSSDGEPRLQIAKPLKLEPQIYSSNNKADIPAIPLAAIEPFLSQPLVVEAGSLEQAARIVGTQEGRVFLARGDLAYVAGASNSAEIWQIYRPGKALIDPLSQELLGHEAFYLGTARRLQDGDPAPFEMIAVTQEVGRGDRLLPAPLPTLLSYVPRKPQKTIDAKVISVYGGVNDAGRYSIIALNQGTREGLEVGHVLSLWRATRQAQTRNEKGEKEMVMLPEEKAGLAFVFRTFERVSYALVMETTRPISALDSARTPDGR